MKNLFIAIFVVASATIFAQKPVFTNAKVKAATVYFNAAEISQNANVILPAGTSEIVVKNIANYINESTIQVGAPNSVTVLSVQFTNNYISEFEIDESNPAIKKVRDSITYLNKEAEKVKNAINTEQKTLAILDKNQQVFGINTGLSVLELTKMMDYYKIKNNDILNNILVLNEKYQKIVDQNTKLNNKLQLSTQKEEKNSSGKLVIQVMNEVAGNVNLDINYITNSASWSPFYDLRVDNVKEPINMMYKAHVTQNSGIDWKKVKLTLSSGNPSQNNQAPDLGSWFLQYNQANYSPMVRAEMVLNDDKVSESLAGKVSGMNVKMKSSISNYTTINENQMNVSFDIDIPYDVLSNGKVHSVALKEIKLPASYKYFAIPKVEKEAFLLAEISDYSKYNLLPGEANIIFEGLYVGKTNINPSETSDTLNLSMGRDKKVSIKREKIVDKSGTKFLSSKKEQTFTYDITVRNNKKEGIKMTLKDQYPLSSDKDIEITLLQKEGATANSESGILTWNLDLKPNETKKLRISYVVKYAKDKSISNL
jgi:uncharacterized protein (TIGR02231 family)